MKIKPELLQKILVRHKIEGFSISEVAMMYNLRAWEVVQAIEIYENSPIPKKKDLYHLALRKLETKENLGMIKRRGITSGI